jgi:long-chain fatty acid transport protein
MAQSFYSVALAKEISRGLSVGVAPILAHQQLKVVGGALFAPFSIDPTAFSDNGTDHSWGASVRGGLEWKIAPGLRVGVAGHPRIFMTKFDNYRGLLPEQGDLDVPATLQAGVAYDVTPNLTLMADYKRIWFSSVASLHNPDQLSWRPVWSRQRAGLRCAGCRRAQAWHRVAPLSQIDLARGLLLQYGAHQVA